MKRKFYLLVAITISLFPLNIIRVSLYRLFFGFNISQSKIGWLTILNVQEFSIYKGTIGSFNLFTGPFSVQLQEDNTIGSFNYFRCGSWATKFAQKRRLILKKSARVSRQHYFDLFGEITIGERSRVTGIRSQFWTHGGFSEEVDIHIGNDCYIGSGVKFTPNSGVSNKTLCAMGSVVSKYFIDESIMIGGTAAKIIKKNIYWREDWK